GPFDDLDVTSTVFHLFDSSIAKCTARTWYSFASSPNAPDIVTGLETFGWTKFRWLPLPPRSTNPAATSSAISSRIFGGTSARLWPDPARETQARFTGDY